MISTEIELQLWLKASAPASVSSGVFERPCVRPSEVILAWVGTMTTPSPPVETTDLIARQRMCKMSQRCKREAPWTGSLTLSRASHYLWTLLLVSVSPLVCQSVCVCVYLPQLSDVSASPYFHLIALSSDIS